MEAMPAICPIYWVGLLGLLPLTLGYTPPGAMCHVCVYSMTVRGAVIPSGPMGLHGVHGVLFFWMYLGSRRASCRPPYDTAKCASE
jgi:hypothetical protein